MISHWRNRDGINSKKSRIGLFINEETRYNLESNMVAPNKKKMTNTRPEVFYERLTHKFTHSLSYFFEWPGH